MKQVVNGWVTQPAYDASAARAVAASTDSTSTSACPARSAWATAPTSSAAVVTPSVSVVGTGVSSGGGRRKVTEMAGQGSVWSSGWPCTSSAIAPDVQPPLPEIGGPQNLAGTRRSFIV